MAKIAALVHCIHRGNIGLKIFSLHVVAIEMLAAA